MNWIPCREREPAEYGRYLVTMEHDNGKRDVGPREYDPQYGWAFSFVRVVAWMPLPELPEPCKGE